MEVSELVEVKKDRPTSLVKIVVGMFVLSWVSVMLVCVLWMIRQVFDVDTWAVVVVAGMWLVLAVIIVSIVLGFVYARDGERSVKNVKEESSGRQANTEISRGYGSYGWW